MFSVAAQVTLEGWVDSQLAVYGRVGVRVVALAFAVMSVKLQHR